MKTIAFFNNKGGVGKTSLVYHLAWMYRELGLNVIAADLDPQANLTSMFLDEERLEELWPDGPHFLSIQGAINPILKGTGDISDPHIEEIEKRLGLIPGDLELSNFEFKLSEAWPQNMGGDEASLRTTSAFYRIILKASEKLKSDIVLIDVGPNLGAINRAALISAEYVVIPLAPDLFSLQGLRNLGPTLEVWREEWNDRLIKKEKKKISEDLMMPKGLMKPIGYVVLQHAIRQDRPVKAYDRWMKKIPNYYRKYILREEHDNVPFFEDDEYCFSTIKHYRSLMPMAMEARKPMFFLKPADGAIGAHVGAVKDCYEDFKKLANRILNATK
jgi:chromosome partitioning protein